MHSVTGRTARSYPLRTLLLWLVVALVVPTLVLAAIAVQRVTADARGTAERRLIEEARELIRVVDDELEASIRTLTVLSNSSSLQAGDLEAFRSVASRFLPAHPVWDAILLTVPDGRHVINTARPPDVGLDTVSPDTVSEESSFARALKTARPVIGSIRTRPGGQLGFPIRVPIVRDGEVRYVLSAVVTVDRLTQMLPLRRGDDWLRTVIDAENLIVARSRRVEAYVGGLVSDEFAALIRDRDEVSFESTTLDGEEVYTGVSRGDASGWLASVSVPRAVIEADFRRTMALLGMTGALLLGLGGVAALAIARQIAKDMAMATEAASALVAGRPVEMGRPRMEEVRQLSDALTRSAALLRTREEERDARVRQADAARVDAETAMRAKDEFLAMLGHELRNPLAPVLNALHVAEASGGVLADRERRIVERQVRHMARLVDDLLDMSRLHLGTIDLHLESCDLRTVVNEAVEMTHGLFDDQRQRLSVDVPDGVPIECDAHRITQVLANLLANAAKYTGPEGEVRLHARVEGDAVIVTCEDNGIGLSPDLLARVFDPFVQGPRGIDRRQGGLGLGLAVARSLVERHGGTISAHSDGEGRGSRFVIRLPVRHADTGSAPPVPAVPQVPSQVRVLVVEDNDDVRDMLVLALSLSGVETRGAASAAEALAVANEWRPQVAVLDIGLPDMDGFHLARTLREVGDGAPLSLMALTGYGGDAYASEAREAGFDAFFVKPVGVDALLDAIARLNLTKIPGVDPGPGQ
jgi:signal transduction histidine kinase/ActR/RegA family two-component response regulator